MQLQNPPHWCHVIKDKHSGVSSCNVGVYYCLQTKLQEGDVFMSVCHSVHRRDASRGGQVPYGIYPAPPENRQSMGRHARDILQECILVPKIITYFIQAQWCVLSEHYHYLRVEWSGRSWRQGCVALTFTLGTNSLEHHEYSIDWYQSDNKTIGLSYLVMPQ